MHRLGKQPFLLRKGSTQVLPTPGWLYFYVVCYIHVYKKERPCCALLGSWDCSAESHASVSDGCKVSATHRARLCGPSSRNNGHAFVGKSRRRFRIEQCNGLALIVVAAGSKYQAVWGFGTNPELAFWNCLGS